MRRFRERGLDMTTGASGVAATGLAAERIETAKGATAGAEPSSRHRDTDRFRLGRWPTRYSVRDSA
jgi:hypothetical protein